MKKSWFMVVSLITLAIFLMALLPGCTKTTTTTTTTTRTTTTTAPPAATTTTQPSSTAPTTTTTAAPATTTTSTSSSGQVYKLTYALFQPATAALSLKNTEFAKEIEKRTNNRVQITVFQAGSLLAAPAMYEGVKNGVADMGNCLTVYNPGVFPFTKIAELPNGAQSAWVASYAITDFLTKYQPKEWDNVHILTAYSPGADLLALGMGKAQVTKLEDWKGKTVRTVHADVVTALGGTVKDVPMADVYDSISKGVIDGVLGSSEPLKSWKLGDVTKYVTLYGGPVQPSILWYNFMNKAKWNSLPADIQKIISDVSAEYTGKLGLTWDEQAVAGIEYAKSQNDTIYVLPKDETDRWTAAVLPIVEARLKSLASSGGFSDQDVRGAWEYFKGRVDYWNGQQATNNVKPLLERLQAVIK